MPKPSPLILLVEDEPGIRSLINETVEEAGFRIEAASNYADGLVLLKNSLPAVLIANVLLPDGDGHKLAEAARRLGVPTLLVSGHPEVIVEAEREGIPFLAKPFGLDKLKRVIQTLIKPIAGPFEQDCSAS